MASHTEEPPSPEAEAVFATFVEEVEQGAVPDIEVYCARHVELAHELRRLHGSWTRLDALLDELAQEASSSGIDEVAQRHAQELVRRLQNRMPRASRYRVDEQLARGGMGTVLRVIDRDLRRRLAMKVLLDREHGAGSDVSRINRFVEEAQITGLLEHPGIVPVHDLGIDEKGTLFFTMRLVEGRDLGEILELARQGDPSWSRARVLGVVLKVCEALAFAHSRGVVHRDLKPANVMVGSYGETYVMDWGLARVLPGSAAGRARASFEELQEAPGERAIGAGPETAGREPRDAQLRTKSGDVVGTPSYMAPEQAHADLPSTGPRSDVYSLGAILYRFLSGVVPYVDGDERVGRGELLGRVRSGPPRPLREVAADAPPELAAICEKAMARRPEDRYAGMAELAEDLHAFLDRRVVQAFETGAWAELKKWVARNRATAASIGVALFAVVALLSVRSFVLARGKADLLLLSDMRLLARLSEQAEGLWPPDPARIPEMDAWLADARAFVARRGAHLAAIEELVPEGASADEVSATPLTPLEREELELLRVVVDRGPRVLDEARATRDPELREKLLAKLENETALARTRLDELEERARRERNVPSFSNDERGWPYESHAYLVRAIDAFDDPDPHRGRIASVEQARELALGLEEAFAREEQPWADTVAAVAASPLYGGLVLEPQVGLAPLGPDPDSGLFEFAHLSSGEPPERGEDDRLRIGPRSSIVLVLLPGGSFRMGAELPGGAAAGDDVDPEARFGEQPVHEVRLAPFLLSKYELTQAQWLRATGSNPSYHGAGFVHDGVDPPAEATWTHPVEQVTWNEAAGVLERMGLELPTEAQWEYAARAGTRTPYWSGRDPGSLVGGANLGERGDWRDGVPIPMAVDGLRANGFGLHHMTGNVWEWCRDPFNTSYLWPAREGDGLRQAPYDGLRVVRGGGFDSGPATARSAFRNDLAPDDPQRNVGVRPAWRLRTSGE